MVTTLTRQGMPLIRYRTGDLARFLTEPCPCGSLLPRMERVAGRLGSRVRMAGGELLCLAELDEALFPLPFLLNFRPELRDLDGVDLLELSIETLEVDHEGTDRLIRQALLTVPALAAAAAGRRLILGALKREQLAVSGTVKRTFIDQRKDEIC